MCDYDDVYRSVFFFQGRGRGVSGEVGVSFEGDEYIRVRMLGVRWGDSKAAGTFELSQDRGSYHDFSLNNSYLANSKKRLYILCILPFLSYLSF